MKVEVKNLSVGNTGLEFGVFNKGNEHLGDLYVTNAGLVWCKGRTSKRNGKTMKWSEFISHMMMDDE